MVSPDWRYQMRAFVPKREIYNSSSFNCMAVSVGPHLYFEIGDDEFWELDRSGVLDDWNERYGTILGEFEEDFFECDLEIMLKEVVDAIGEGDISKALRAAVEEGTGVFFFF